MQQTMEQGPVSTFKAGEMLHHCGRSQEAKSRLQQCCSILAAREEGEEKGTTTQQNVAR